MTTAVVGGGIIGLSLALELRRAGEDVTVVERAAPGSEASNAAAGILGAQAECDAPGAFFDLCLQSRAMYPAFAAMLEDAAGFRVDLRREGVLEVALGPEAVPALDKTVAWQLESGQRAERLSPEQARRLEPSLSPDVAAVASFPEDASVDNRRVVQALTVACERAGVVLLHGNVRSLWRRGEVCRGLDVDGSPLAADSVVLAAGSFTSLIAALGLPRSLVQPAHGQMLALRPARPLLTRVLFTERGYLVPRSDGRIIAGSTLEWGQFEKQVTGDGVARILAMAHAACPELEGASLEEKWSGLRPVTADRLPILGPGPLERLFLATGHFRNGILLAPVTAKLLTQSVLGRAVSIDLKPYAYDRPALRAEPPTR